MAEGAGLLAFLTLQRAAELCYAQRNTRRLLSRGAYEVGAGHYPTMIALHATWLATLWAFGWSRSLTPAFVVVFVLLQVARVWVLRTLGERWTTRVIIVRGAPRITSGPYVFLSHPNYAIVALEVPCASLALGLRWHAIIFGVLNLAILAWRIRVESAHL
ncbi:MAG: hypothetical protein M3Z14_03335 [Candidatus Eremiobacteraeota bacterium]|nr:hypothetical protein [Candidatus Eremiobacteraeota bacterium]